MGIADRIQEREKNIVTALEIVQRDKESLYIGNLNTVEFDLSLPAKGIYGSDIAWKSGHPVFLTDDGKVSRPAYGMGTRVITLTATFCYEDAKAVKEYEVRILEQENDLQAEQVYPVKVQAQVGHEVFFPSAAIVETKDKDVISHPVVWEHSGSAVYDVPGVYEVSGLLEGTKIPVKLEISVSVTRQEKKLSTCPVLKDLNDAQICLTEGTEFYRAQERMRTFLLAVDADQMLYNFRAASGLSTKGAPPMEGWDSPDSQLRGHTTGHFLSALALCYHACGDEKIKEKAVYMVSALSECQQAFSEMPGIQEGFLSGYSEEQFDLLEEYTVYPKIWAPYYTLHKIFAGLLDCYKYIGDETALEISDRLGGWVYRRLSRLSRKQRSKMWSMYIAGEFGGMNEVMAKLYQITGKEEYLECARMFDNDKLFYPLSRGVDALSGMHANQHIPQILGALEIFRATGEEQYYNIAGQFWSVVTEGHIYAPGGTGEGEMFRRKDVTGALLTKNTQETCASYNMLKLTKELYQFQPDVRYMDYYERTLLNHILATPEKKETGESTYFFPLAPGSKKEFERENSCCHGTGMENHFKYREAICFRDEETLYVNLFIPCTIKSEDVSLTIRKAEGSIEKIDICPRGDFRTLAVRKPCWCREDYRIRVNGREVLCKAEQDGYFRFEEDFTEEVLIELEFPIHLSLIRTKDRPELAAVQAGPYILAAVSDEEDFLHIPIDEERAEEVLVRQEGDGLEYRYGDIRFIPLFQIDEEAYHVYINTDPICERQL